MTDSPPLPQKPEELTLRQRGELLLMEARLARIMPLIAALARLPGAQEPDKT